MEKISEDKIAEELAVLALVYPAAMINPQQQMVLAPIWAEDLGHLTEKQFLDAVAEYRQNNKFFPCTADIREAHDTVQERFVAEKPKLTALPVARAPGEDEHLRKVVQLQAAIKRRNPNMSYAESGRLARKSLKQEPAA